MKGRSAAVAIALALLPLLVAGGPSGCASSGSVGPIGGRDSLAALDLDRAFLRFRQKIQSGPADSLVPDLSRESLRWLEDIRQASRIEPIDRLTERPFHEILLILALRVERRFDPAFDDRNAGLLNRVLVQNPPIRRAFLKSELGPSMVRGDIGTVGLREAPKVPVFHFVREGGVWRFHLERSLPLILQGAESLARQRKSTRLEQAIWLLDQVGGRRVLPEDLNR